MEKPNWDIIYAGKTFFVKNESPSRIAKILVPLGTEIESYCGEDVLTSFTQVSGIYILRFNFSHNRYIEFHSTGRIIPMLDFQYPSYLQFSLKYISNNSMHSLVMRVLVDIFHLD